MLSVWCCILLAVRNATRQWQAGVWAGLLGLLGSAPAGAQAVTGASAALPFRFEQPRQRKARLPFEFQRNLIIVAAHLNGQGP